MPMKCRAVATHARGAVLSHRDLHRAPVHEGELLVVQQTDPTLRRAVRVARLNRLGTEAGALHALPPLYDAQLLWMGPQGFTLSGVERLQGRAEGYVAFAQSWWVRLL
jgi:hypothetical protein